MPFNLRRMFVLLCLLAIASIGVSAPGSASGHPGALLQPTQETPPQLEPTFTPPALATSTASPIPTNTAPPPLPTSTATATVTAVPPPTNTPAPPTRAVTMTPTALPLPTNTATVTVTALPPPSNTPLPPTHTATMTGTASPLPTDTVTMTTTPAPPTSAVTMTPTALPLPTDTATATAIPSPSPTPADDIGVEPVESDPYLFTTSLPIKTITLSARNNAQDLIGALEAANPPTCANHTVIELAPGQKFVLTSVYDSSFFGGAGLPVIRCEVSIHGNGTQIVRDGDAPNFRIFGVNRTGVLRLSGISVENGHAVDVGGGGILSVFGGQVYLTDSVIEDNVTEQNGSMQTLGAGVYSYEGALHIAGSRIRNNRNDSVTGDGGGVGVINARLTIVNSEI